MSEREKLLSQSGLLVPRDDKKASFYHLSFQEFLAAERLFILMGLGRGSAVPVMLERGVNPGWRNTLGFLFGGLVSKYNASVGVGVLQDVLRSMNTSLKEPSQWKRESSNWKLALVLGDCLEILMGRGTSVPKDLREFHEKVALRAIELEIEAKDRHTLAVVLGRLGDPRIVEDLRVIGLPEEHSGYVKIPEGKYVYGERNKKIIIGEPFWLTRYPVTNSQYTLFMKEDGYKNLELWSQEGREWLDSAGVGQPKYWRHLDFSGPNQPIVGVSYWEAEAFAQWAGGRLPTERQWEAAARGREGFVYPWGNDREDGICNSSVVGLGCSSAVGIFPRSRSREFALHDMAGNVWEWCADLYDKRAASQVFRGGSWDDASRGCRSSIRFGGHPSNRIGFLGFRVALVLPGK